MFSMSNIGTNPEVLPEEKPIAKHLPVSAVDWACLVAKIQGDDPSGMEELYRMFSRGIRLYLCRQLGLQELDDKIHDTFLIVINAIKRGDLREPERLMGFVRTVVRRQVASHIDEIVHMRNNHLDLQNGSRVPDGRINPEMQILDEEKTTLMEAVLSDISLRDREILIRFYLYEESQEQICEEMELSETQFRLLKSRAKARFGNLGRKKVGRNNLENKSMRSSASSSD